MFLLDVVVNPLVMFLIPDIGIPVAIIIALIIILAVIIKKRRRR